MCEVYNNNNNNNNTSPCSSSCRRALALGITIRLSLWLSSQCLSMTDGRTYRQTLGYHIPRLHAMLRAVNNSYLDWADFPSLTDALGSGKHAWVVVFTKKRPLQYIGVALWWLHLDEQ